MRKTTRANMFSHFAASASNSLRANPAQTVHFHNPAQQKNQTLSNFIQPYQT
jgi:hypothetical protein